MIKITLFFNLTAILIANSDRPKKMDISPLPLPGFPCFCCCRPRDGTSSSGGGVEDRILSGQQTTNLNLNRSMNRFLSCKNGVRLLAQNLKVKSGAFQNFSKE